MHNKNYESTSQMTNNLGWGEYFRIVRPIITIGQTLSMCFSVSKLNSYLKELFLNYSLRPRIQGAHIIQDSNFDLQSILYKKIVL